jgi:hypothetical protein
MPSRGSESSLYMSIPCPVTFIPKLFDCFVNLLLSCQIALMKDKINQILVSTKVLFSIIFYMNGNFYSPNVDEYGG